MAAKLKTAVLGATGYSGLELTRLLARHPLVSSPLLLRRSANGDQKENPGETFSNIVANGLSPAEPFSWTKVEREGVALLFLATPNEVSRELVPDAIECGLRIVDLSGAWRLTQ